MASFFNIKKDRAVFKFCFVHYIRVNNNQMFSKLPAFTKNFYFITALVFVFWMLFFDSNDLLTQYRLNKKLNDLENEKAYFEEKIAEVKQDREELLSNKDLLEKFARENYFMKKENEDLFIIVEKD